MNYSENSLAQDIVADYQIWNEEKCQLPYAYIKTRNLEKNHLSHKDNKAYDYPYKAFFLFFGHSEDSFLKYVCAESGITL